MVRGTTGLCTGPTTMNTAGVSGEEVSHDVPWRSSTWSLVLTACYRTWQWWRRRHDSWVCVSKVPRSFYFFSLNSLSSESIDNTCIDTPESRDSFKHSAYFTNALEDITINTIGYGRDTIEDHNDNNNTSSGDAPLPRAWLWRGRVGKLGIGMLLSSCDSHQKLKCLEYRKTCF